jgi:hypothetical protein
MVRCQLLGHRFRFTSEGDMMRWSCQRGCGAGGAKRYPTADDALRYVLPLRIVRALRGRRRAT